MYVQEVTKPHPKFPVVKSPALPVDVDNKVNKNGFSGATAGPFLWEVEVRDSFNPREAGARLVLEGNRVSAPVISPLHPTPCPDGGSWNWQGTPDLADLAEGHQVGRQYSGSGGLRQDGLYSNPTMS